MKPLKRVVIKEELVELTGDFRPALILNQFIYWIERMYDTDKYILEEKERALKHEIEVSIDESKGWVYKTAEELNDELMIGMSVPTIRKYIKQLVEKGYLIQRRNPKYKWDKTMQYRVDLYKVQLDLGKMGYVLEGFKLLPNIKIVEEIELTENENVESNENKEAPTFAEVEAEDFKNLIDDNIIPNSKENYSSKSKEKEEKNSNKKEVSEVVKLINNSCVNIKKEDLKKCEEEFTDIDKLKESLEICEMNNNHGIKNLRMAYKYGNRESNDNSKGASSGVNDNFKKYEAKELEEKLRKSQEGKFEVVQTFNPSFTI